MYMYIYLSLTLRDRQGGVLSHHKLTMPMRVEACER